jgi:hypothetical protein
VEGPAGPVTPHWRGRHPPRPASSRIWSSEEAASVREARERALAKAEAALTRIRNGLGGRYFKTRKQADTRVAQILTGPVRNLISARTGTKAGKPVGSLGPASRASGDFRVVGH